MKKNKGWKGESKRHAIAAVKGLKTKLMKKKGKGKTFTRAYQYGTSDLTTDRSREALPPGRRRSKNGKYYSEYRRNRSDITNI